MGVQVAEKDLTEVPGIAERADCVVLDAGDRCLVWTIYMPYKETELLPAAMSRQMDAFSQSRIHEHGCNLATCVARIPLYRYF